MWQMRLDLFFSLLLVVHTKNATECPNLALMCYRNTNMCTNALYSEFMTVFCAESCNRCTSAYRGCKDDPHYVCDISKCTEGNGTAHYTMAVHCPLKCGKCQHGKLVEYVNPPVSTRGRNTTARKLSTSL